MKITFLGGAETVTGSKYLVHSNDTRVLIDCGLYQGYKWLRERNWQTLPVDLETLDAIVLTHAHLDHSGYIPLLFKRGFKGKVYTHHATKELCNILLPDSGHIQEEDARFYLRHKIGKHAHPEPLYDRETAINCIKLFEGVDFEETFSVGSISFTLQDAGHILGAASIILEAEGKRVGFSGDVGRPDDILMNPPKLLPDVDLLMLESTYGNRQHDRADPYSQLEKIVNETAHKGGVLLVPSFTVGRAQALLHVLETLIKEKRISKLPIYLDSPMAINVSNIYCKYSKYHRLSHEQCNAFCNAAVFTNDVESSKAIADQQFPHIIIAGSGMATGGRILHHFKRLLGDHRTTVLFTGYQAAGTRGAKMLAGVDAIKVHGQWIRNRSNVEVLHDLSGHGDYLDLTQWLKESKLSDDTKIMLVHGDPDALEGMRDHLKQNTKFDINVAAYRSTLTL